jgi:hypothetical protein
MPTLPPVSPSISVGVPFFKLISLVHQKFSNIQKKIKSGTFIVGVLKAQSMAENSNLHIIFSFFFLQKANFEPEYLKK